MIKLNTDRLAVSLTPFGASLASMTLSGHQLLRTIESSRYAKANGHFGSIAGPIANRVGGAVVNIDSERYSLPINDGHNTLHGGPLGLGRRVWDIEELSERSVTFILKLADGELGLPGERIFRCCYDLLEDACLQTSLTMVSSRGTLCNLAPHPYFCLDQSGSILDHRLAIYAEHYLPTNHQYLPTGEISPVSNTRFDFREPQHLRALSDLGELSLDHNYCFPQARSNEDDQPLELKAMLKSDLSNISLSVYSNQRGLQVYTPHRIEDPLMDGRLSDKRYPAICLEPQSWPDATNHHHFPSIYVPSETLYKHISQYHVSSEPS